jgi:hypothetical protein
VTAENSRRFVDPFGLEAACSNGDFLLDEGEARQLQAGKMPGVVQRALGNPSLRGRQIRLFRATSRGMELFRTIEADREEGEV